MSRPNPLVPDAGPPKPSPYSRDPWRLVECPTTGLVYLENPPDYQELEETFAWEKTFESERRRRQQEEPILSRISDASKRARRLIKRPRKIATLPLKFLDGSKPEALTFVDIGSGDGKETAAVSDHLQLSLGRSVQPVAVEISKAQAAEADGRLRERNGGYCLQASALEGARRLKGLSAELILLSSFLEHEVQPVELLAACRELLAPEGIIVIKVPNFDCWNRRLRGSKWCGFRYPDHVNYFTPYTLRIAIERAGLRVARMKLQDRSPLSDNMYAVAALPRRELANPVTPTSSRPSAG